MRPKSWGTINNTSKDSAEWLANIHKFVGEKAAEIEDHVRLNYPGVFVQSCGAIERGLSQGAPTTMETHEARGIIKFSFRCLGIECHEYHPGTVKKAVRHGKLKKAEMRQWVSALLGVGVLKSPDEADALAVAACCAASRFGARFPESVVSLPEQKKKTSGKRSANKTVADLTDDEIAEGLKTGRLRLVGRHVEFVG
jgi:Holliday junction resolvasome RuvABC endonuclease subunit